MPTEVQQKYLRSGCTGASALASRAPDGASRSGPLAPHPFLRADLFDTITDWMQASGELGAHSSCCSSESAQARSARPQVADSDRAGNDADGAALKAKHPTPAEAALLSLIDTLETALGIAKQYSQTPAVPAPTMPGPEVSLLPIALESVAEAVGDLGAKDDAFQLAAYTHGLHATRQPALWRLRLSVARGARSGTIKATEVAARAAAAAQGGAASAAAHAKSGQLSTQRTDTQSAGDRAQPAAPARHALRTRDGSRTSITDDDDDLSAVTAESTYTTARPRGAVNSSWASAEPRANAKWTAHPASSDATPSSELYGPQMRRHTYRLAGGPAGEHAAPPSLAETSGQRSYRPVLNLRQAPLQPPGGVHVPATSLTSAMLERDSCYRCAATGGGSAAPPAARLQPSSGDAHAARELESADVEVALRLHARLLTCDGATHQHLTTGTSTRHSEHGGSIDDVVHTSSGALGVAPRGEGGRASAALGDAECAAAAAHLATGASTQHSEGAGPAAAALDSRASLRPTASSVDKAASTHINLRSVETLLAGSRDPGGGAAPTRQLQHHALRCGSHREAFHSGIQ